MQREIESSGDTGYYQSRHPRQASYPMIWNELQEKSSDDDASWSLQLAGFLDDDHLTTWV